MSGKPFVVFVCFCTHQYQCVVSSKASDFSEHTHKGGPSDAERSRPPMPTDLTKFGKYHNYYKPDYKHRMFAKYSMIRLVLEYLQLSSNPSLNLPQVYTCKIITRLKQARKFSVGWVVAEAKST